MRTRGGILLLFRRSNVLPNGHLWYEGLMRKLFTVWSDPGEHDKFVLVIAHYEPRPMV